MISGSSEAVRSACERVRECVTKVQEIETLVSVEVPVPMQAIGRLIGRGGANIRAIQRESGAKVYNYTAPLTLILLLCVCVKVNVPSGGGEGEVQCEVVGTVVQIDRAVALVRESIQQSELSRRRRAVRQKARKPVVSESGASEVA